MKTLLVLTSLACLAAARPTGFRYTLEGHIEGMPDSVALIDETTADTLTVLHVTDGKFRYEGRYDEPAAVSMRRGDRFFGMCYLEPGNIRIEGRTQVGQAGNHEAIRCFTSGTPANDAFGASTRMRDRMLRAYNFEKHPEAYRTALLDSLLNAFARDLAANTGNVFGITQFSGLLANNEQITRREVDSIVRLFPPHLRSCRMMRQSLEAADRIFRSNALDTYVDFTATDTAGRLLSLREVVDGSRYVLLDFWFFGCVPCCAEIPYLKAAYDTYHTRGFEIVGVSRDKKEDACRKAIRELRMTWINLIDANGRICDLYSVLHFPTNYLIDCTTGRIVARDLRGDALATTLAELLRPRTP